MHLAWSSKAALAMAPLQDVLNLGADARMNTPGQPQGNWRWRFSEYLLLGPAFQRLKDLTSASGRAVSVKNEAADPVMEVVS